MTASEVCAFLFFWGGQGIRQAMTLAVAGFGLAGESVPEDAWESPQPGASQPGGGASAPAVPLGVAMSRAAERDLQAALAEVASVRTPPAVAPALTTPASARQLLAPLPLLARCSMQAGVGL